MLLSRSITLQGKCETSRKLWGLRSWAIVRFELMPLFTSSLSRWRIDRGSIVDPLRWNRTGDRRNTLQSKLLRESNRYFAPVLKINSCFNAAVWLFFLTFFRIEQREIYFISLNLYWMFYSVLQKPFTNILSNCPMLLRVSWDIFFISSKKIHIINCLELLGNNYNPFLSHNHHWYYS